MGVMNSATFRLVLLVSLCHALVHVYEHSLGSVEQMIVAEDEFSRVINYTNQVSPEDLHQVSDSFNRPATIAEILLEMIEHSIHHRGQITVYYRLLNLEPISIPYII